MYLENLEFVMNKRTKHKKAETAFGKALELNPNDSGALNYLGYWWAR